MTDPMSEPDEAVKLTAAAERYATLRGIRHMPLDDATREMGAFTAGWNTCREAYTRKE